MFVYTTLSGSAFYVHCTLKQEFPVLIIFLMASEIFMLLDLFSFPLGHLKIHRNCLRCFLNHVSLYE